MAARCRYDGDLILNKGALNQDNQVKLPEGITRGKLRAGDVYQVDPAMLRLLPDADISVRRAVTC